MWHGKLFKIVLRKIGSAANLKNVILRKTAADLIVVNQ